MVSVRRWLGADLTSSSASKARIRSGAHAAWTLHTPPHMFRPGLSGWLRACHRMKISPACAPSRVRLQNAAIWREKWHEAHRCAARRAWRVRSISRDPSPPASTPETLRGTHAHCVLGKLACTACPARSTAPVRVLAGVPTCECQHAENFVCTDRSNFSTAPVGTQIMYSELLTVPARPRAML